ncbi:hypothetical protein RM533_06420 [Croceicoccus sp. F390]|uniref:Heme oxygenase n=1 Tax=Croceicoccus esteveae TaxID=3075597 RepID=A0ABU2ZGU0_9SPHN|nr:hypothetical protein [Croceicoccus sp. F390]MDT0575817.1 hypothetical protein [Croceicoccus sp. F390]
MTEPASTRSTPTPPRRLPLVDQPAPGDLRTKAALARARGAEICPAVTALDRCCAGQLQAIEQSYRRFDPFDTGHYRAFLLGQAMALPGLENSVRDKGWSGWKPRFAQLMADLADFGMFLPKPMLASHAQGAGAWGIQYALETLQGSIRTAFPQVAAGMPARYLNAFGDHDARWRAFCRALAAEGIKGNAEWSEMLVDGATEAFQHMHRGTLIVLDDTA